MDIVVLARWQFAITTIFHFFFVPLTLGLSIFVAILETKYVRSGDEMYKKNGKVLGEDIPDQLCDWCCYRHRTGVPVWHELVRIFAFYGRYFRGAARY